MSERLADSELVALIRPVWDGELWNGAERVVALLRMNRNAVLRALDGEYDQRIYTGQEWWLFPKGADDVG